MQQKLTGRAYKLWSPWTVWTFPTSLSPSLLQSYWPLCCFPIYPDIVLPQYNYIYLLPHVKISKLSPMYLPIYLYNGVLWMELENIVKWRKPITKDHISLPLKCESLFPIWELWLFPVPKYSSLLSSQLVPSCHSYFSRNISPSEAFPWLSKVDTQSCTTPLC